MTQPRIKTTTNKKASARASERRGERSGSNAPAVPEGVSIDAWLSIGAERTEVDDGWRIPERDGDGQIIGYFLRLDDGRKLTEKGGHRGLTMAWPLDPYAGSSPADPILIVEGQTDTAAGLTLGLTTIGRPSATGGLKNLQALLKGRHVCIIGENDGDGIEDEKRAGKVGAEKTAAGLPDIVASTRVIFPPKGIKDLRAWVTASPLVTKAELLGIIRETPEFNPPLVEPAAVDETERDQPSQSERLVRLALEHYRVGVTDAGEPFAVARSGRAIVRMFRGSRDALRATLAREIRQRDGITPNASALSDALTVLEGEALDADPEKVHLRIARHRDGIVMDLGTPDGRVAHIIPGSWSLIEHSPVLFRRTALTAALREPQRGGDLVELRRLLNVTDETWPLVIGWLLVVMIPDLPHPILLLGGEQGTGKSTAARMLAGLVDPSPAPLRSEPRDPEAWVMTASGSWIVSVDNVSRVPGWWSDALCKAVTGDGWVRRRLFSDNDLLVLAFRRAVVLTSIDAGAMRGDLGDLERISENHRRTEAELDTQYERMQPLLLGALLDVLADVLAALPNVTLPTMPRMADFARVLAALDQTHPELTDGRALKLYLAQHDRIAGDVVDGDPVAQAIVRLVEQEGWSGTAGELLEHITPERPGKAWPTSARGMSGQLRRLIPALRGVGISIDYNRGGRGRIYTIGREAAQPTDTTDMPSPNTTSAMQDSESTMTAGERDRHQAMSDRHAETPACDPLLAVGDDCVGRDGLSARQSNSAVYHDDLDAANSAGSRSADN